MKLPAVLCLALLLTAASAAGAADEVVVSGKVYQERDGKPGRGATDPGLAGVQVSNGRQIVRSAGDGSYRLPVREGDTVFVVKPDGYTLAEGADGLPAFWHHYHPHGSPARTYPGIAATTLPRDRYDFALQPARRSARREGFQMLVFSDPQTANLREVGYYEQSIIAPLAGRTKARLGTTLGDIANDDLSLYPAINRATTRLGVPWFHVPGNHDLDLDADDDAGSLDSWRAVYGPDTYAVEEGGASFVFLDDVIHRPAGGPRYIGGLREDQFAFLQAYLKGLRHDRLLVLGMHIPLFDAAPGRETFRHADRQRLFALLAPFTNVLVLSGHSHTQQHYHHGPAEGWQGSTPLHEYNVGANCGAFWSGVRGPDGVPASTMSDGTPRGHALLDVAADGSYRLQYRVAGAPASEQIGLHAPKALRRGAYPAWGVYANVYMGEDASVVEYRVDGGAWQPMKQVRQADPRLLVENVADDLAPALRSFDRSPEATASPHLWRGALPTDLAAGAHAIEVRARQPDGSVFTASTGYQLLDASP